MNLSTLLETALRDLDLCSNDPNYIIDMTLWHAPRLNGKCMICLAGAYMAQTLHLEPGKEAVPSSFDEGTRNICHALDELRLGNITTAANYLGLDFMEYAFLNREIFSYSLAPDFWREDMNRLLEDLKNHESK